jgi:hypothetical protein
MCCVMVAPECKHPNLCRACARKAQWGNLRSAQAALLRARRGWGVGLAVAARAEGIMAEEYEDERFSDAGETFASEGERNRLSRGETYFWCVITRAHARARPRRRGRRRLPQLPAPQVRDLAPCSSGACSCRDAVERACVPLALPPRGLTARACLTRCGPHPCSSPGLHPVQGCVLQ